MATGRLPNTYTPYDSNGNPYGYFNSSRQEGKTPSPDAPRVEDVSGDDSAYCNSSSNDSKRVYDREAVAEYAKKYASGFTSGDYFLEKIIGTLGVGRNPSYPSFPSNCANFTSQALEAAGIVQNEEWHAEAENGSWNIFGLFNGYKNWDYTHSWSVASDQYEYFSSSIFCASTTEISFYDDNNKAINDADIQKKKIEDALKNNNIQVGDLLFFVNEDQEVYHSTIITKTDDDMIYYSGNTTRYYNKALLDAFDPEATSKVIIVSIKDNIPQELT